MQKGIQIMKEMVLASTGAWKDVQHHWSSEKCKSKPPRTYQNGFHQKEHKQQGEQKQGEEGNTARYYKNASWYTAEMKFKAIRLESETKEMQC